VRHVRILGLALIAVFAMTAVAAASASAEQAPKFMKCVKAVPKNTGKYSDKACTKAVGGTGGYELELLGGAKAGLAVTKAKGKAVITTRGISGKTQVVECSKTSVAGELYNTFASGKFAGTLTFEKCVGNKAKKTDACTNITYKPNFGETLWGEEGEAEPVLLLVGGPSFSCGGESVEVLGNLIGTLSNTTKGVNIVLNTSGGNQQDRDFWSEGEEISEYYYTRWYTGPEEEEAEDHETTVASTIELAAKATSVDKV
jgi:hypothetical protein